MSAQTPATNPAAISATIRRLRRERGLTQEALAQAVGVSPQAISKWETGQTMPDITLLLPLSKELGIGVDLLLGGDRRKEFEERFQKAIPLGEELTLLVSLDALKEFPNDKTFRYRLACDEKCLGERSTDKILRDLFLNRAAIHFRELHNEYPEDDIYTSMLAETLFAMGKREEAMKLAGTCKEPQREFTMFLEGDEKRRYLQERLRQDMMALYGRLFANHSREALAAACTLMDTLLGEDIIYTNCFPYTWEAELCREEGNTEGFVSALTKVYEAAKKYDEIPFGSYPYRAPLFDLLTHEVNLHGALLGLMYTLMDDTQAPLLADPAAEGLRRRIVEEEVDCHRLFRHEWMAYFQFCQRHVCESNYYNFSIAFDLPYHENTLVEWMKRYPGYADEAMLGFYKAAVEELVGGGIMSGYAAYFGNDILAYCNCGAKEKYKCLPIPDEERAIPTAPEGAKILSIVEVLVSRFFTNCGIEEKMLEYMLTDAKRRGFTHIEAYPLERMELDKEWFGRLLSLYEKMGFTVIRDLSSELDGRYFIMQKEL
ncbi:MAG: helix-turn-helix transcriptional regulator [Clostridia bacterium]|nr:helix-turn-helix transcriptional regulator [Clostridia bacterium]